jgi:hypothetical protein
VVWQEHGDNISRTNRRLEICQSVLQILKDLKNSPQFGPLLPKALLTRRIRFLEHATCFLHMSARPNAFAKCLAQILLLGLLGQSKLYARLPLTPRMVTRPI